jgi:hypothetical protein
MKNHPKLLDNDDTASEFIKFSACLCMKAADGSIVNGWLASQADIITEDWYLLSK